MPQRLNERYPETPIPLDHSDPFTLLIAVLLSAQCTDKKVNEVTLPVCSRTDAPGHGGTQRGADPQLHPPARACPHQSEERETTGQILLNAIKAKFHVALTLGRLARRRTQTASVVMAQAFGVPAFPVDTHIHRLAQRWGLTDGSNVARTETDLKRLFPKDQWNRLHLQIIYYGREHCTARGCDGRVCPMCRELYPNRRKPVIARKP